MTSEKQILANVANAQKSTGPRTEAGKATSSRNAVSHGLTVESATLASLTEEDQADFDQLRAKLRDQLLPVGELEEQIFQGYSWSLYQCDRARAFEAFAQTQWEFDMENEAKFRRMERMAMYRQRHERAAERSLKELGRIQRDRLSANQPNKVMQTMGFPDKKLSAALPVFDLRQKELRKGNPFSVANEELMGQPTKTPKNSHEQNEAIPR
jgi:hypothetical protein